MCMCVSMCAFVCAQMNMHMGVRMYGISMCVHTSVQAEVQDHVVVGPGALTYRWLVHRQLSGTQGK